MATDPTSPDAPLSVLGQRWKMRACDMRDAAAITQQLEVPELIGRILVSRQIPIDQAASFLHPTLREYLPDPLHLKDMEKAAQRIIEEIHHNQEKPAIAVFGDYDVDGATSSALLVRYFRAIGIEVLVHIPDRLQEGYGPNTAALLALQERGARLVITVDCGTMSFAPLKAAHDAGLDVIVVDHHKSDTQLPIATAIVNPNRYDETSPHIQMAAVGVTFLLLVAVNRLLRIGGVEAPDLLPLLDIVALGTICDVVPLTGVNRALVTQGIKVLRQRNNPGIVAVMDAAKLTEPPGAYHAGFIIGPRINAGGRVGKSDLGVRLLTTEDPGESYAIAAELERLNAERKAIEAMVQEEAMEDAVQLPASDAVIVVAREGWHPGVIGIVAGRLKEHFHKPVAVIALENGMGKASARSITGVDLGAAVIAAVHTNLLIKGGGHAMAAGFTIEAECIPALREFFNQMLQPLVSHLTRERTLWTDGHISAQGMTPALVHMIEQAGPFGAGNPSVRLIMPNVRIVRADIIKENHVRVIAVDASPGCSTSGIKAMAFRSVSTPLGNALLHAKGRILHLAGHARINQWQGRESVDFMIEDAAYA